MRTALTLALGSLALATGACGGDDETTNTTSTAEPGTSGATGASGPGGAKPEEGGGGSGAGGESNSVQVADAVVAVVGSGDPEAACATSATTHYVNSSYGDEQGCRAAVEEQGSFEVTVEEVRVDSGNGTAEATAVPGGGPNHDETLTVRLVEESGEWKVDFLRSDAPAGP